MDVQRFRKAALQRPTAEVEVPELKGVLFDENEPPILYVRGLEFNEQQLAKDEVRKNSLSGALKEAVEKADAGDTKDLVTIATKLISGAVDNKPAPMTVYLIEIVLRGTLSADGTPVFHRQDVVKLAKHFPTTFEKLSGKINTLNGEPSNLGGSSNGTGQIVVSAPQ